MKEVFVLGRVFFKTMWFNFQEKREIGNRYPDFTSYERLFRRAYRFSNPFRLCREFIKKKTGFSVDAYGETPLPVFEKIVNECALSPKDRVLEMGCGRGKGVFFLSYLAHCSVIGVDWVPTFIQKAREIALLASPALPVTFFCQDMFDVDFSSVTCIYLYGTCLEDEEIVKLISCFEALDSSVRIITVSYPLSDYSKRFTIQKQWISLFPWGEAEIYVNGFV